MHIVQTGTDTPLVGSANNERLRLIDADAQRLVASMIRESRSIRQAAAELVVVGVLMAQIRETDRPAWDDFRAPFGPISVKGDEDREYREIAHVLWRKCKQPPKGEGSLARAQVSRDKISRDAAAMAIAHIWFKGGVTDSGALAAKIIDNNGVRGCATLRSEKLARDRGNSGSPKAPADTDMIAIRMPRPYEPLVIIVMPSGHYREAEAATAQLVLTQTDFAAEFVH